MTNLDEQIEVIVSIACGAELGLLDDEYVDEDIKRMNAAIRANKDRLRKPIKALIAQQVKEARIDELGKLMPPVADMIPEWKWPCYMCGFDRELLRKHIEDRIAALKGDK